jgi:hypothetical protein
MLTAILNTYAAQNSRRRNGARDRKLLNGALSPEISPWEQKSSEVF